MGKINEYSVIGRPINVSDMLFISDASASHEIKSITFANLHSTAYVRGAQTGSDLKLQDGDGDTAIYIKDGGNVGVGTVTPDYKLDIEASASTSSVRIFANAVNGYPNLQFENDVQKWSIYGAHGGIADGFDIYDATAAKHRLFINTSGSVGLGTTAPTEHLHLKTGTPKILVEGSSYTVYLASDASSGPGLGALNNLHIQMGFGGIASRSTYFYYDATSGQVTPLMVDSVNRRVGMGTNSPSAPLHIEGTGDLVLINTTTGVSNVKFTNNGSNPGYWVNQSTYFAIGNSSSVGASTHLQINKGDGFLSIGGTLGTFTFPLEIKNAKVTTTKLNSTDTSKGTSNTGAAYVYLEGSGAATADSAIIFGNASTSPRSCRWMCGQFWHTSENYFGIEFLGDADITANNPDNADLNGGTLNNTTVYISEKGGITSQNTALAFGRINGKTAGTPTTTIIGSYNITNSATITSGGVLTVSFTKDLTSANYTVIATGYIADTNIPLIGRASTKGTDTCAITFRQTTDGAVVTLLDDDVEMDFVIYGGFAASATGAITKLAP